MKAVRNAGGSRPGALRLLPLLLWIVLIILCYVNRSRISAETILSYTPPVPWLAALILLALFALKSLSIVLYSGILYTASGLLFPLPAAFLLNLCGSVVMFSLPYFIGKRTGARAISYIRDRFPKTQVLHELQMKSALSFSFISRLARIPCDVASLYMGAANVEYGPYLLGSVLGCLPHMITYPIVGMSAGNIRSPQFLFSCCAEAAYVLLSALIWFLYRKKHR